MFFAILRGYLLVAAARRPWWSCTSLSPSFWQFPIIQEQSPDLVGPCHRYPQHVILRSAYTYTQKHIINVSVALRFRRCRVLLIWLIYLSIHMANKSWICNEGLDRLSEDSVSGVKGPISNAQTMWWSSIKLHTMWPWLITSGLQSECNENIIGYKISRITALNSKDYDKYLKDSTYEMYSTRHGLNKQLCRRSSFVWFRKVHKVWTCLHWTTTVSWYNTTDLEKTPNG